MSPQEGRHREGKDDSLPGPLWAEQSGAYGRGRCSEMLGGPGWGSLPGMS